MTIYQRQRFTAFTSREGGPASGIILLSVRTGPLKEDCVGAHAYGYNWETLGVHLCGNFEGVDEDGNQIEPTKAQIENAAYLIGYLCDKYHLVPDKLHVVGHRDLMATACPGIGLYKQLQDIRGKAIWYMQNYQGGD